ncbi:MAG: tetratricopeptide repeat protein [Capsulimonadaceae bacterium]
MSRRRRSAAAVDGKKAAAVLTPTVSPRPRSLAQIAVPLALGIVTLLLYLPACAFQFIPSDDNAHILENPYLNPVTPAGLTHLWTAPFENLYIPMSYMAYAFVSQFARGAGGTMPFPFHTANVILHAVNTLLVYAILLRLVRQPIAAGLGAALFGWHPVQVESVAWISEMRGTLCGLFSFVSILSYLRFAGVSPTADGARTRWSWWLGATALYVLALLSKPTAVALPLVVAVLDLGMVRRRLADVARSTGPWLLAALVIVFVTRSAQVVMDRAVMVPIWLRPVVACDTLAFYLGKVVVPLRIAIDYSRSPHNVLGHWWGYAMAAMGLAAIALCARLGRRKTWIWAAAGIFVAAILPNSGLVPFAYQATSTVADRYLYVAMLGPALGLACALAARPRPTAVVLSAAVLTVYAGMSCLELPNWHDTGRLFQHAVRVNPQSWYSWTNLGEWDLQQGNIPAAADADRRALSISGTCFLALEGESYVMDITGHTDRAIDLARRAIAAKPTFTPAYGQLGVLLVRSGRYGEADSVFGEEFRRGVSGTLAGVMNYWWGSALLDQQRPAESKAHLVEAVKLEPTSMLYSDTLDVASHAAKMSPGTVDILRGNILAEAGRMDQANTTWREAALVYPHHLWEAHQDLANAYFQLGRYPAAESEFNLALADKPANPNAQLGLGATLAAEGKVSAAVAHYKQALILRPDFPDARRALAAVTGTRPK